jgi:hypothetical protein
MAEEILIESIARNYRLDKSTVIQYRQIPTKDAIEKFLTDESKSRLEEKGYNPNNKISHERNIGLSIVLIYNHLPELRNDFYRTQEGTLWYELNIAVQCAMAGQIVSDLSQQIFDGQTKQYSPAQKVALEMQLDIDKNVRKYRESIRQGQAKTRRKLEGIRFKG